MTLALIFALAAGAAVCAVWFACRQRTKCQRWCVISGCIVLLPLPHTLCRPTPWRHRVCGSRS